MELLKARSIGESLLKLIGPAVKRAEIAGSVRREKETVKDIELVIIVDDYEALFGALRTRGKFIKPGVPDIIEWPPKAGAKYLRLLLDEGIKLDVFVATTANWGGIFMLRTGSGVDDSGNAFNGFSSGVLQRWKKISKGGKMQNGILIDANGNFLPQNEESQIFDLVGLKWIPPNQRTSKSIIKKYEKHTSM
jgi:DNA polymerase (family 10)